MPLRKFYNVIAYLDHLLSEQKQMIESRRIIHKKGLRDTSNEINYLYIANCLHLLDAEEVLFLKKFGSRVENLFIVTNCSEHLTHYVSEEITIFTRDNVGRDLAAMRDFLKFNSDILGEADLCIFNSSCLWSLEKLIRLTNVTLSKNQHCIWFGTESKQYKHHYQTFLIIVPKELVNLFFVMSQFIRNWRTKRAAVIFGELTFADKLSLGGIEVKPIYTSEAINQRARSTPKNLNHSLIDFEVLLEMGAPFMKKKLVTGAKNIELLDKYIR